MRRCGVGEVGGAQRLGERLDLSLKCRRASRARDLGLLSCERRGGGVGRFGVTRGNVCAGEWEKGENGRPVRMDALLKEGRLGIEDVEEANDKSGEGGAEMVLGEKVFLQEESDRDAAVGIAQHEVDFWEGDESTIGNQDEGRRERNE